MKDIAIYGAGGFGREVACLIQDINRQSDLDEKRWNLVGFFDDGLLTGAQNDYGKILGGISELNSWTSELNVVIALGSPHTIKKIVSEINNPNIKFPNLVSPDIKNLDLSNYSIGKGNIICSECLLSCNVHIGNFNVFNWKTTIGHDTQIGNYNVIMPNVNVSGGVMMGNCNLLGVGSVIIQLCKIGDETIITSNSVLYSNAKDGKTYMGNPAKKVKIL